MRTKAENFRSAPKPNFDLYAISFICTNCEAFTTFSAIFTRIRCAIGNMAKIPRNIMGGHQLVMKHALIRLALYAEIVVKEYEF